MLEVRAATRADLESAADCIASAFHGADRTHAQVRDEVLESVDTDPFASLGDLRVGILGGEVVSAVAIVPRPVHMGGTVLSMGGHRCRLHARGAPRKGMQQRRPARRARLH